MTLQITTDTAAVVVGLGKTGLSVVRHLRARGARVAVTDNRSTPPELAGLRAFDASLPVSLGHFDESLLADSNLVVASPGVATTGPFFNAARRRGVPVVGDIELFAADARAPIAGISGTNGKSTVTTLLGRIAARAGRRVKVGGNLGEPALDLLDPAAELYVLELSSYQLDTTNALPLAAGVILNISPDHLDRYGNVQAYAAAKARLFMDCAVQIVNADDWLLQTLPALPGRREAFSLQGDSDARYRLQQRDGADWLTVDDKPLLAVAEMKIAGLHNAANALACIALADALQLPRAAVLDELREFAGLPHRTQWVAERRGVRYIDDSKGTNVGATLAAVGGLPAPLIVIAGGDGKGQDFAPLAPAFRDKVRHVVLIGRDARALGRALTGVCALSYAESLPEAVAAAAAVAVAGDTVLLSPACASLDMFRDYAHRGEVFATAARGLPR
jgi:UDP-N-acetylmuramoylalanine--D-glutamate ligase